MALDRIRKLIPNVLSSAISIIPVAGQFYSTFRSNINAEEAKQLLLDIKSLNESQKNELLSQIIATNEALDALTSQLEKLVSRPQAEKLVVVVPVGGAGGSMFPITSVMPKCLVYVGERTLLQHIINSFIPYPDVFKKVIVISRSFSSAIKENIRQGGYGKFVECHPIDKPVPAALSDLKSELEGGPFLLHYNDILIPSIEWDKVYDQYKLFCEWKNSKSMLLCSSYYPIGIGVISEKEPGVLEKFEEKPYHMQSSSLANMGVAIFDPILFKYIRGSDGGIFEDSFKRLIDDGAMISLFRINEWEHVHELKDLYSAQKKRGEIV